MTSTFSFLLLCVIHIVISLVITEDIADLIAHCGQMWLKRTTRVQHVADVLMN